MTYSLLCYKKDSSSIVDWIRGKDGLNVNNSTLYDLLSFVLKKIKVQLSLIELEEKMD